MIEKLLKKLRQIGTVIESKEDLPGRLKFVGLFKPLTPNDHYSSRTAPLTSKRFILYIYSTNIGTEYFKHGI